MDVEWPNEGARRTEEGEALEKEIKKGKNGMFQVA